VLLTVSVSRLRHVSHTRCKVAVYGDFVCTARDSRLAMSYGSTTEAVQLTKIEKQLSYEGDHAESI
jgi:hypothetical protein